MRRVVCCMLYIFFLLLQIIPIVPGLSECCHGKMINPQEKFCCDFKIQDREYGASTGCCRLALWKYIVYNKNKHICCARELQERKPYRPKSKFSFIARQEKMGPLEHAKAMARVSCCNQRAYDTLHQICCALRVSLLFTLCYTSLGSCINLFCLLGWIYLGLH